eukprot:8254603-Pyramimonas_sp.AAC.1
MGNAWAYLAPPAAPCGSRCQDEWRKRPWPTLAQSALPHAECHGRVGHVCPWQLAPRAFALVRAGSFARIPQWSRGICAGPSQPVVFHGRRRTS